MPASQDRPGVLILCKVDQSGRAQEASLEESMEVLTGDQLARRVEDDLAESHFTTTRRKEAEVNEGGLVETEL